MVVFVTIVNFVLFIGVIISPIFIFFIVNKSNIKFKFIAYLTIGFILTAIIMLTLAWWADTSDIMLLKHYGYNKDGMNETEFYGNVSPGNMDRVKSLEKNIMGIGWPVKAIMSLEFYFPFILIIYILNYLICKYLAKKKVNIQTPQP
jgi:hypothetical protein